MLCKSKLSWFDTYPLTYKNYPSVFQEIQLMTKGDIIELIAEKSGMTVKDVKVIVEHFSEIGS